MEFTFSLCRLYQDSYLFKSALKIKSESYVVLFCQSSQTSLSAVFVMFRTEATGMLHGPLEPPDFWDSLSPPLSIAFPLAHPSLTDSLSFPLFRNIKAVWKGVRARVP